MSRSAVSQHEMRKLYNVLHRVFAASQQPLPVLAVEPQPVKSTAPQPTLVARKKKWKLFLFVAIFVLIASTALFFILKRRGKAAQKGAS